MRIFAPLLLVALSGFAVAPVQAPRPDRVLHPAVRAVIDTKMDERDDAAMVRAFGEMTATCVACHVLYLDDLE